MDKFPEKVSITVFLTALLPYTIHQPSYFMDQVYVVCEQDELLPEEFQRWMIESSGVSESDRDGWRRSYANVFKATRTLQCFGGNS
ncbi:hypothetical protein PanWU01x14_197530 [Parasponia andersonii]|uniref:Uncharacterized protein n=1 Tax=Parasponia andersonii TaxID=3476 RepID=A0A2P5BYY4_PARAD|nr:hypothetical protein PanWU01x14_197530 [Parasponia andersonii]